MEMCPTLKPPPTATVTACERLQHLPQTAPSLPDRGAYTSPTALGEAGLPLPGDINPGHVTCSGQSAVIGVTQDSSDQTFQKYCWVPSPLLLLPLL